MISIIAEFGGSQGPESFLRTWNALLCGVSCRMGRVITVRSRLGTMQCLQRVQKKGSLIHQVSSDF